MFTAKKRGGALISEGMTLLTKATDSISEGIKDNLADVAANIIAIEKLEETNNELNAENFKHSKIVANFKKNILGEE